MKSVISVEREIAASPDAVWALVSDLPRMGEWSPENQGGKWLGGATGPAIGAKFRGSNRNGFRRWSTLCRVTQCEPGKAFAFSVTSAGFKVADWGYAIAPTAAGCTVTETFTETRGALVKNLGTIISGVSDRDTHNRAGMEATLEALGKAAEAAPAS